MANRNNAQFSKMRHAGEYAGISPLPQVLRRKLARRAAGFVFTHGMRTYQVGVWLWVPDWPELSIVLILLRARLRPPVQFLQPFPQFIPAG
jgi:hypothetical protein